MINTHNHFETSKLDGMGKIVEMVARAKELGQSALAITDHGTMAGLHMFQEECLKQGIKPILGCEFYVDDDKEDRKTGHLVLLAKNNNGLQALYELQERAYLEAFYRKPRIRKEWLEKYTGNIVVTSACLANNINQAIMKGNWNEAREDIKYYKSVLGSDFYLEIQPAIIPEQLVCNKALVQLAKEQNVKLVVGGDTHYVYQEDAEVHEVLLALSTNTKMNSEKRFKFPSKDFWLRSEKEMIDGIKGIEMDAILEGIASTEIIANKCNASIDKGNFYPKFPFLNKGETADTRLREITYNGFGKLPVHINKDEYLQEVNHELDVIINEGFADYFLIVQDAIKKAHKVGILTGDRGSAGGSKVAYLTDISNSEPTENNCLFERFLDVGRIPD